MDDFRAPFDCLQYHTGTTGVLKSFNFASGQDFYLSDLIYIVNYLTRSYANAYNQHFLNFKICIFHYYILSN